MKILLVIAPVFTIIAIGFIVQKLKAVETQSISNLVIDVFIPCLIFSSIVNSSSNTDEWLGVTIVAVVSTFALLALSWTVANSLSLDNSSKTAFILSSSFGNTGNYGLPLAFFAFGAQGLHLAAVFFMVAFLLMFTVGVLIASRETRSFVESVKNLLHFPLIYAVVVAIAVRLTGLVIPQFIMQGVDLMSQASIGCMLIVLGLELGRYGFDRSYWKLVSLSSGIKLLLPLLIIGVFSLFGLQMLPLKVDLLQACMPTAVLVFLITVRYGGNSRLVMNATLLSTIASVVTLTLLMSILL